MALGQPCDLFPGSHGFRAYCCGGTGKRSVQISFYILNFLSFLYLFLGFKLDIKRPWTSFQMLQLGEYVFTICCPNSPDIFRGFD